MPKLKQRGFTLIELVVVIVILGILAAFAVPRFMGLEDRARIATLTNMEGTLQSAATMAYGVWEASGGGATVNIPGLLPAPGTIAVTNGYPTAVTIQQLLQTTPAAAGFTIVGNNTWRVTSAPTPATCAFTYTASAGPSQPPVVATVSTAGC